MNRRAFLLAGTSTVLVSCGGDYSSAPQEAIEAAFYHHGPPYSISLITVIAEKAGWDHSAILINGTQRVIYDPAGSFRNPATPRGKDIHYGIDDRNLAIFYSYHARNGFYVEIQTIEVPLEVADFAYQRALKQGVTNQSQCTQAASRVLGDIPGFTSIQTTFWPKNLRDQFARLPNREVRIIRETDEGQNMVDRVIDMQNELAKPVLNRGER